MLVGPSMTVHKPFDENKTGPDSRSIMIVEVLEKAPLVRVLPQTAVLH